MTQLSAFFTSAPILASSAAVNSFSAKATGHTAPSSRFALSHSRTADYRGIPTVTFTIPPLAGVGLTEAEARRQQLAFRVKSEETSGWYSNRRVNQSAAMFKTLVDNESDRILGAHLLGEHAEEVINLFALAIRQDLTATDLKHQLYSYPTSASDLPY